MQATEILPILLVDDSEEQRHRVRGLLAARPGLAVEEADDGRRALERAAAGDFACILLDVRMPGLDGFDVAEELRKGDRGAFVPIIFLTGAPAPDRFLKRGYSLGAVDFVSYPLIPEVFLAKLEVFLQLSQKTRVLDRYAASLEEQVRQRTMELEYQSRLTRTITGHATAGLFLLDAIGRVAFMNPAAVRITGFSRPEAGGLAVKELLRSADPRSLTPLALSEGLAAIGKTRELEDVFLRRDDSEYHGRATLTGLILEDGKPGALLELQDVTERRLAERALRENEEKLHQARKLESVGRLAGGIAHDFNNILTGINGYSSLCLGLVEPRGSLYESLSEIRSAGERAAALTRQLLAFGRQQVLAPKRVDINACISDSLVALAALAGERTPLNLELDPELGQVRTDPEWIRQILISLIRNARDAMPEGGVIRIRTARCGREVGEAGATRQAPFCMLSVADSGMGMDANVRARIFEPFFTTKEFGRGSGMGLAMVDGIVSQCGGQIEVDSHLGQGTTFRLYFPEAGEDPRPALADGSRAARDRLASARGSGSILLADGDHGSRVFMRRALESQGYPVLDAGDGDGLAAMASSLDVPISLVILDLHLPGMQGMEAVERFRRARPGCPCLFVSRYTDDAQVRESLQGGAARFLQKPFTVSLLRDTVREILATAPASGAAPAATPK